MKQVTFTLTVAIVDRKRLRRAALLRAMEEGLPAGEWRSTRIKGGDPLASDVQMIFDIMPFSEQMQAGVEIGDSHAETLQEEI